MSKMISTASGFQNSVNIAYDMNNPDKIKNFIPTKSAIDLLEEVLLSTNPTSTERARVLIGAYGKGKSHIVLMILSILLKTDLSLFEKILPTIKENKKLYQELMNYYESENKILPVVISGSNTSLTQAFLLSLQRTLSENELLDIMPDTNYEAAISVIDRWENEFPEIYNRFIKLIEIPINEFRERLEDFDVDSYKEFEKIYPSLTGGSQFNPFLGFDIVNLYEKVATSLKEKGFSGLYVVYDEFSKFLETNISEASVSDTKMLQDFAEKCNRSGKLQLHFLLISHKEIANYIDKLPKQKIDGWRGVSERFKHIHLNNNFVQTYEIIASVIQKNPESWAKFLNNYKDDFKNLSDKYKNHNIFIDDNSNMEDTFKKCYPLHPISMFILPRLSERVAQNERTLFTFLSAQGVSTLPGYLDKCNDDRFQVITPDLIYDYFEPLFRKEVYINDLHEIYFLTSKVLEKLEPESLERKLIKTLALIYILEQFERLKPTKDELLGIFSIDYSIKEIEAAIESLIDNKYVVYLKKSNNFLRLKQTSGVDINSKIQNKKEQNKSMTTVKETLNAINFDKYVYPYRYNDDREMVRYFSFEFIDGKEIQPDINWKIKRENIEADGVIYAIIPNSKEQLNSLKKIIKESSKGVEDCIFILPKQYKEIEDTVREFEAVKSLKEDAEEDKILFDEYEVIYEDLKEVLNYYINSYTRPEEYGSSYYHQGQIEEIIRKAELTDLMSKICEKIYSKTPIINNEAINRNEPTTIALNSRNKIITALLRNELEPNLGFTGGGQEVSIMRSTLKRTNLLVENNNTNTMSIDLSNKELSSVITEIIDFIEKSKSDNGICFSELYENLISQEHRIGLRKGVIPLYIAAVFHEYKRNIVIKDSYNEIPLNLDTLMQLNSNPSGYYLYYLEWNNEKEKFVNELENIFKDYVIEDEKLVNSYDYIVSAMKRWYLSLPKYSRELKITPEGKKIDRKYQLFIRGLKKESGVYEYLFINLPAVFEDKNNLDSVLIQKISEAKKYYDNQLNVLKKYLLNYLKKLFSINSDLKSLKLMSTTSVIKDWCENLDKLVFEQLFTDGTERCLKVFKEVTNDENSFIKKLGKTVTGLRLEDWNSETFNVFEEKLKMHKNTAETFHKEEVKAVDGVTDSYQLTFTDKDGVSITKRFEKTETSNRGKLLYNAVTSQIEAMGQSITIQEKRQIIMNILKELC